MELRSESAVRVRYTPDGWETLGIDWEMLRYNPATGNSTMSEVRHCTLRHLEDVPEFALDDKKLRMVILERDRLHKIWGSGAGRDRTHRKTVRRAGSYVAMLAGIAYRTWRLGWDSPTVAAEMGVSPVMVRQHLYRMTETARMLAGRGWQPVIPEYVEGEICFECKRRPVNKARCKWRCDECQDHANRIARARFRRTRGLPALGRRQIRQAETK